MFDTIAAIASGNCVSAIGIIRLSGNEAISIAEKVFSPASGKALSKLPDRFLSLGSLYNSQGELLDRCMCTVSRAPNSYTGEDTAELHCHGSPTVLRLALEALFEAGARQALAGEFTKRAFLNGKMDLTQAEAVIDLIESETDEAAKNAAGQLGGSILRKIDDIYSSLVDIISHYHAVLDYPDEDIEDFKLQAYLETLSGALSSLDLMLDSFKRGRIMKNGLKAAILGRPNAGKSTLLNALLGYDRAIVTSIAGTTRDTIEESVVVGGVLLRLSDTAGIRETDDPIEKIGVLKAMDAASAAELVLAVFDGSQELSDLDMEALRAARAAPRSIAVINKADMPQKIDLSVIEESFELLCPVSALDKTGLETLDEAVSSLFPIPETRAGEVLTNSRHYDVVLRARDGLFSAMSAMEKGTTPDIVLTQAEEALSALAELTGRKVTEDVTTRIFERFCVGK